MGHSSFFGARYGAQEAKTQFWQGLPGFGFLEIFTGFTNFEV
jgi:hypothetical protein